jgi:cellulose synthase/poly-beta-1,6-N-acetylglucosamine synthase-like glycosyltransferase
MAHNEEANIGNMLEAVCRQQFEDVSVAEVVVVASGCVDRTEEIVREFCQRDQRIRLVSQAKREGKSAAINTLLCNSNEEIIVVVNADTIPAPDAIECLVAPFRDPSVGMTAGRPVPTNDPRTFMGYAVHFLWALHHQLSLRRPKMGELIAFRNIFRQIPTDSAVDEASIEPLIRGQGLRLCYVPEATIYNRGPETVQDYLCQRRRIFAGHVYVRDTLGYRVSTMSGRRILWMLLRTPGVKRDWRYFVWGPAVIALEVYARFLGFLDFRLWKRKHAVWEMVQTTKEVVTPALGSSGGKQTPVAHLSKQA